MKFILPIPTGKSLGRARARSSSGTERQRPLIREALEALEALVLLATTIAEEDV